MFSIGLRDDVRRRQMLDGVTGPERIGSELERERSGPAVGPLGAEWWRQWMGTPGNLTRMFARLSHAWHQDSQSDDQGGFTRVHPAHVGPGRIIVKATAASRRQSWDSARCLITGASSGIGRALAEHLVRAGARVILTGRSVDRLQAVAQGLISGGADRASVITIPADLTVDEERTRLFTQMAGHFDALDLVVNNAGVGAAGHFETHDSAVLRQVFEINVFALAEVCRATLPLLARGNRPTLVNMGSIAARRGLPGRTEYAASKFAVTGFTEALRVEWRRFGVHVLQINPGFTNTPFDQHALVNTARYSVGHLRSMSADVVAAAILRASRRHKREIVLTWHGNLLLAVNSIAPRFVDWGFSQWLLTFYPRAQVTQNGRPEETAACSDYVRK